MSSLNFDGLERAQLVSGAESKSDSSSSSDEAPQKPRRILSRPCMWFTLFILTVVLTLVSVDLYLLSRNKDTPSVEHVDVYLEASDASGDAEILLNGTFSSRSLTGQKLELVSASCEYSYSSYPDEHPMKGGNFDAEVENLPGDVFSAKAVLKNTNFETLRLAKADFDERHGLKTKATSTLDPYIYLDCTVRAEIVVTGGSVRVPVSSHVKRKIETVDKTKRASEAEALAAMSAAVQVAFEPPTVEELASWMQQPEGQVRARVDVSKPAILTEETGIKSFVVHAPAVTYDLSMFGTFIVPVQSLFFPYFQ